VRRRRNMPRGISISIVEKERELGVGVGGIGGLGLECISDGGYVGREGRVREYWKRDFCAAKFI